MTLEELRNAVCRYIDENREAYNETGDECYRAVKEELLHILGLIDSVDHEPVGNSDKMTLTELAHELRKLVRFKYLTVTDDWPMPTVMMWSKKPEYGRGWNIVFSSSYLGSFNCWAVRNIDLSEYKDADGNIDYSKCIVEVG